MRYNLHPKASQDFKKILQDLMDRQLMKIGYFEIDVSVVDSSSNLPKPLAVHHTKCTTSSTSSGPKLITIQVPIAFPCKDNKVVPWRYEVKVCVDGSDEKQSKNANSEATNVTNIVGLGSMTRSDQIYSPSESRTKLVKETKSKEVVRSPEEQRKEIYNEEGK